MSPIKTIGIPSACHKSWNNMLPAEGGRHCESCCKTVVNFASMTDNEIISYLGSHKAVCGRFETQQLKDLNHKFYNDNRVTGSWWKRGLVALTLFGPIATSASAQNKQGIAIIDTVKKATPVDHIIGDVVLARDEQRERFIRGYVLAKDDGLPIPGARISAKGIHANIQTMANGHFEFQIPDTVRSLTVSAVGYVKQDILLSQDLPYDSIALDSSTTTKCVLVGGLVVRRMSVFERIWYKIRSFF